MKTSVLINKKRRPTFSFFVPKIKKICRRRPQIFLVILSPLPPFQEGGNRRRLRKGMVGDRGFEPPTSMTCPRSLYHL
jgi:hypothetical protein